MTKRTFHTVDYIVFSITIILSLAIGFYYAINKRRQKTTTEYLVGSRSVKVVPLALSLVVSLESAVMLLGFSAEIYRHGLMFWLFAWATSLSMLIGSRIIPPLIHPLKITTIYGYLGLSYNSDAVRYVGSTITAFSMILKMAIVLFGPAIALEAVTNIPQEWSMIVICVSSMVYTSLGGFKAVIWTDVLQTVIMMSGVLAVLIKGTILVGGPSEVLRYNQEGGRLHLWSFDPDVNTRHSFWSVFVGGTIKSMCFTVSQPSIQRLIAAKNIDDARTMATLAVPVTLITMSVSMFQGLIAFAYYSKIGCDPLANGDISNPNQIIPYLTLDIFEFLPGMPGLFIAAVFSASLSTLSSLLNALSAITVDDYLVYIKPNISENLKIVIAKISVFIYGSLATAIAFMISNIPGTLSQIAFGLMASFIGPVVGLIFMTALIPWVNSKGAIVGVISSCIVTFWISTGSYLSSTLIKEPALPPAPVSNCMVNNSTPYNYTLDSLYKIEQFNRYQPQGLDKLYSISYLWLDGLAILIVFVVGCAISFVTGPRKSEDIDSKYHIPVCDRLCCCLPNKIVHPLQCGLEYNKTKETDESISLSDHTQGVIPLRMETSGKI